ncbi:MAG: amidase family protein [Acidimicrobiales bacterium]
MSDSVVDQTAVEQRRLLDEKAISARELLDVHLERIDAVNGTVNAVVGMDADVARATAAAIDEKVANGADPGPLGGLVTAHKDLTETADFVTTFGSPLYADNRPAADSLLVSRVKAAGAVALGKTNTPEFGAGSHSFNPVYGTTVNPYDTSLSAGGSSGGAAAALRCGMIAIADGSDAGGSLRNPAAWNNVVGFRTSPRMVPNVGPGNPWQTMGISGPMARTVDDLILQLRVHAQVDTRDPLNRPLDLPAEVTTPSRPLRVAWSPTLGGLPVEADIAAVLETFVGEAETLGWTVTEDEPDFSGADECFITTRAYMFLNGPGRGIGDRLDQVKATVRDEIERGRALSADEVGRAFTKANELWQRAHDFFENYDLMIGPVTQVSPFPIEQEFPTNVDGKEMPTYLHWMLSNCRISAFMLPTMSLPAGFTAAGLPVGAQLIGRPLGDLGVLEAAKALEAATNHHRRQPPVL